MSIDDRLQFLLQSTESLHSNMQEQADALEKLRHDIEAQTRNMEAQGRNIEAQGRNIEEQGRNIAEQSLQIAAHSRQLEIDAQHIRALARIAEIHDRRLEKLEEV